MTVFKISNRHRGLPEENIKLKVRQENRAYIGETRVDPSHPHPYDLQCLCKCTEETLDVNKGVKRGQTLKEPAHKQIHSNE